MFFRLLPFDQVLVVSIVLMILAVSCGTPPKGEYYIPETVSTESGESETGLPGSAAVNLRELPYIRNAFKEAQNIGQGGLDDFYATTRGKVQHIAIVSGSSLDSLKAFVANGWAPIIVVQLQGRSPEILPLSSYDDRSSEITLQNPTNLSERRVSYKDFEMSWAQISRNKCVLITPQQLTEANVQKVLERYLPAAGSQGISVRSR